MATQLVTYTPPGTAAGRDRDRQRDVRHRHGVSRHLRLWFAGAARRRATCAASSSFWCWARRPSPRCAAYLPASASVSWNRCRFRCRTARAPTLRRCHRWRWGSICASLSRHLPERCCAGSPSATLRLRRAAAVSAGIVLDSHDRRRMGRSRGLGR